MFGGGRYPQKHRNPYVGSPDPQKGVVSPKGRVCEIRGYFTGFLLIRESHYFGGVYSESLIS